MFTAIKKTLPYILLIGFFGLLAIQLGMTGLTYLEKVEINGFTQYRFNLSPYLLNINLSFDKFVNNIQTFYEGAVYNWDGIVNSIKSIGNIVVAVLNTLLMPFSILASFLNILFALVGFPLNDSNFIYSMFSGMASLQIPYIEF